AIDQIDRSLINRQDNRRLPIQSEVCARDSADVPPQQCVQVIPAICRSNAICGIVILTAWVISTAILQDADLSCETSRQPSSKRQLCRLRPSVTQAVESM
ncbi:hypothetical protein, partial [Sutterella wadsworthensis]|uniref:hypothetical protein n=1 Tax=Sutterella wadsworthensis TaxID=40545 RepID=UPI003AF91116